MNSLRGWKSVGKSILERGKGGEEEVEAEADGGEKRVLRCSNKTYMSFPSIWAEYNDVLATPQSYIVGTACDKERIMWSLAALPNQASYSSIQPRGCRSMLLGE